jgi:site-specific recombinase XerC
VRESCGILSAAQQHECVLDVGPKGRRNASGRYGSLIRSVLARISEFGEIAGHILKTTLSVIRQYLNFLIHKGQLKDSKGIAQRLIRIGTPSAGR